MQSVAGSSNYVQSDENLTLSTEPVKTHAQYILSKDITQRKMANNFGNIWRRLPVIMIACGNLRMRCKLSMMNLFHESPRCMPVLNIRIHTLTLKP